MVDALICSICVSLYYFGQFTAEKVRAQSLFLTYGYRVMHLPLDHAYPQYGHTPHAQQHYLIDIMYQALELPNEDTVWIQGDDGIVQFPHVQQVARRVAGEGGRERGEGKQGGRESREGDIAIGRIDRAGQAGDGVLC